MKALKKIARLAPYGWGMISVGAQIGNIRFTTSLFHKDWLYVLPIENSVRKAEGADEGANVEARIQFEFKHAT